MFSRCGNACARVSTCVCVCIYMHACTCVHMHMYVCLRERERGGKRSVSQVWLLGVSDSTFTINGMYVHTCMRMYTHARMCAHACECVWESERWREKWQSHVVAWYIGLHLDFFLLHLTACSFSPQLDTEPGLLCTLSFTHIPHSVSKATLGKHMRDAVEHIINLWT